ncbi:MAG: DUF2125 domain-containing protein [Pseudomonadota bacterium]
MNSPKTGAVTLAFVATASSAMADVTATDIWNSWQTMAQEMGQSITADGEARTSQGLVVSNVTVTMDMPEGAVAAPIGDVTFVENGDGTVSIEVADQYPLRITGIGSDGESFDVSMVVRQPGLALTALGDAANPSYTYSAPEVGMGVTELMIDGEPVEIDFDLSLRALTGGYDFLGNSNADSALSIGALAMRLMLADIEAPGTDFSMNLTMQDISSENSGSITPLNATQSLGAMLGEGFASTGELAYGAVTYGIEGGDRSDRVAVEGSIENGIFSAQMGDGGILYGGENNGIAMTVSGTQIPFPSLEFAMEQSSGSVTLPLAPSDDANEFALLTRMTGLTVDDRLWSMIDPGRLLPRNGADLVIDLLGSGRWLVDITDPEQAAGLDGMGGMPGEIDALTLRELRLSAVGAELTGSGDFTFESTDDGIPQPAGAIDLNLTGANTLLDRLVSMGLVPEEQAMGARMMLGLFARPGPGTDALVSKIEVTPDGSVTANGQRIR